VADPTNEPTAGQAGAVDELAHLELQAASLEAGGAPGAAPGAAPPGGAPDTTADELRQALVMVRMIVAPGFAWWEGFETTWSDSQLTNIAGAGAAVMQRHGVTMGELLSTWGPYIALVGATLPPAVATYTAIKHRPKEGARRGGDEPAAH